VFTNYGTFVIIRVGGSERSRYFDSRDQKFQGVNVPSMELSLPGAKVQGNDESSIVHHWPEA